MLSTENPPDPSCYSKFPGSKNHAAGSEKLPLQKPDLASSFLDETKLPKFSIRDYVVSARIKDIQKNWPFQQQFLQICLKHGVKNLLPPFEPPDSVRTRCYAKKVGSDRPVACVDDEKAVTATDSLEEERVCSLDKETADGIKDESSDRFEFPLPEVGNGGSTVGDEKHWKSSKSADSIENSAVPEAEIASTVTVNGWIERKSPPTKSIAGGSIEQSEKKSILIDYLGFVSESSRTEEIVSNSSTGSDPMASKICPVCKAFASTSNTTLNAHMDQCLKLETSKRVGTHQIKHRVKPRKKRSMVDICAAARRCTLQDLDRMNGTNWAENLGCLESKCDFETDKGRKRQRNSTGEDDGTAVYVDSNGTKVRILSKFNEDLEQTRREEIKQRKHSKESSVDKNRFAANGCKEVKAKPYSKKLSSLKLNKNERTREQLRPTKSGTLRQWVCSKRSILPKQLDNNSQKDVGLPKKYHEQIKDNRFKEGTSHGEGNHVPKILKSSRNSDSLRSFKTLDSHSNLDPKPVNGRKISPECSKNNCNPWKNNFLKITPELPEVCYLPSEPNKVWNVGKTTLFRGSDFHWKKKKCNEDNGSSIFQKPQRHVLRVKTCKWAGEMPPETVEESDFVHNFSETFRPNSFSLSKIKGTRKLGLPKNVTRSETKEHVCERNIDRSNLLKTREEPEARSLSGSRERLILKQLKSGADRSSLDPITIASVSKELAGNINKVLASATEKNVIDPVIRSSKTHSLKARSQIDQCHTENHAQLVRGIEAQVEFEVPSLSSNQETDGPEEFSNAISGVHDQNEAEMDVRLEGNCLSEIRKFDSNSTPKQVLEGNCLSHMDLGFEVLHEESSITNPSDSPQSTTSGQLQFANDQHKLVDRDPSRSPKFSSLESSEISLDSKSSRGDSAQLISDPEFQCRTKEQLSSAKLSTLGARNPSILPAQSQASPSPNPILRLMGKNLMVVSKDEEEPDRLNGLSNGSSNNHPNTKYLALLGFSTDNSSNKDGFSFNREGSLIFGQDLCNLTQNCSVGNPKSSGNHSNSRIFQTPIGQSCHCVISTGEFTALGASLNGKTSAQAQQKKLNKKPSSPFLFNIEGTVTMPYRQDQLPISTTQGANSVQEVIVIDDSPEFENDSSTIYTDYIRSGTNMSSPIGILSPAILNSNLKPAKQMSCFSSQSGFAYRDHQLVGSGPNFFMPFPEANTNPAKRGSNSGGLGVFLQNTSVLPQVSTAHLNPKHYYFERLL